MPSKKEDKEEIKIVACLEVSWAEGSKRVRKFDQAWALARSGPLPVSIRLLGFVRKDSPKDEFVVRF